jgi:hypothetical protein
MIAELKVAAMHANAVPSAPRVLWVPGRHVQPRLLFLSNSEPTCWQV